MTGDPARDAQFGTAFGPVARDYERGRPGYPEEAIDAITRGLHLERGSVVVDLAAGTGKLTRELIERFHRVIAIEPLVEMRAHLARTTPRAEALEGTAEHIPLPDASANAVLVAQAFHWFDGRRALGEIARVLRPGGGLGLLWNTTPWERRESAWFALLDDLLEGSRADLSAMRRYATGGWREAFERQQRFRPLTMAAFDNTQRVSRDEFLANLASRSYVARLAPDARRELLGQVSDLLDRRDSPMETGHVVVPMRTDVYWTRLTG